jgi:hypothetical protein
MNRDRRNAVETVSTVSEKWGVRPDGRTPPSRRVAGRAVDSRAVVEDDDVGITRNGGMKENDEKNFLSNPIFCPTVTIMKKVACNTA